MSEFITKDSGQRQDFATGARRDLQDGKPRYDLIPPKPMRRLADLYARGAIKYGESNWEKGMPASRCLASLMRHLYQAIEGDKTEDHWSGLIWNAMAIMHFEGTKFDDLRDWENPVKTPVAPTGCPENPLEYCDIHDRFHEDTDKPNAND